MIYSPYAKGPYKITGDYDPNSDHHFGWRFRPDVWRAGTVYEIPNPDHPNLVIPTVYAGFYAECVNPGISGATEPTWNKTLNGLTLESNGVIWKMRAFNMMPLSISVLESTWEAQGATVTNQSHTDISTQCFIDTVTATDYFYLINHVRYSNGGRDDFTARFKVRDR